ncbi:hypothetical protein QFC21_000384 [Naganishia friedmannii]|uniref:Uncharacterized protein n=1 Tax=Naganishia friedmannii TaxID=89922 RepID=A0ACC2WBM2_9TREE|nr:hypothetical protein QFC21_000384 [Naganishia friedmannii]
MDDADWDTSPAPHTSTANVHSHTHWERLTTTYADAGYREGITPGKLSTLQRGFDEAFAGSVVPSRRLGQVRGRVAAMVAFLQTRNDESFPALTATTTLLDRAKDTRRLLSRVRRDQVLPIDEEALAHAAAEHPDEQPQQLLTQQQGRTNDEAVGNAWTKEGQEVRERREMERVLDAMEDLSSASSAQQARPGMEEREQHLLDLWEGRVAKLELEAGL